MHAFIVAVLFVVAAGSAPALAASESPPLPAPYLVEVALQNRTLRLEIPETYSLTVAAQGMRSVRFMEWSPHHRLFVGEMAGPGDTSTGRVLVLDDFDAASGNFASVRPYLTNQRNPNSVAFHSDVSGAMWIYVALADKLVRFPYNAGDAAPADVPEIIAAFPDYGQTLTAGGWHVTRTLAFNDDELFVALGSSCYSCEVTTSPRAEIFRMRPDGSQSRTFANGLRNAVGITYAEHALVCDRQRGGSSG